VEGIRDVAECGRGLLVGRVYDTLFLLYRIESAWEGIYSGVGRGYTGVALKGCWVQEEGVGGGGWAGVCVAYTYIEYKVSVMIAYL
jgi:hypothetical protein